MNSASSGSNFGRNMMMTGVAADNGVGGAVATANYPGGSYTQKYQLTSQGPLLSSSSLISPSSSTSASSASAVATAQSSYMDASGKNDLSMMASSPMSSNCSDDSSDDEFDLEGSVTGSFNPQNDSDSNNIV